MKEITNFKIFYNPTKKFLPTKNPYIDKITFTYNNYLWEINSSEELLYPKKYESDYYHYVLSSSSLHFKYQYIHTLYINNPPDINGMDLIFNREKLIERLRRVFNLYDKLQFIRTAANADFIDYLITKIFETLSGLTTEEIKIFNEMMNTHYFKT